MIYLDNAATTFPKPEKVTQEVRRCIESYCGNPGRGSHPLAMASAEKIFECREELSDFFGLGIPENIVFTGNTTHSLNLVIKGLLHHGDHVLISDMEHNSVFRPVFNLARQTGIKYDIFPTHPENAVIPAVKKLIRRNTRLLICVHSPNISSAVLPVGELGELCRVKGIVFAVDAAQSAGHLPINMQEMNINALCLPGHKGLYGIQGCGALCLGDGILPEPLTEGGNGVNSLDGDMPEFSPERYETGTLPTPSIAGLLEGVREVRLRGVDTVHRHECELWRQAYSRLSALGGITVYEPEHEGSVLLFNIDGIPSDRVASGLGELDICVRGGYHCSALGHRTLGTPKGGAVRISFGMYNTGDDVRALCEGLRYLKHKAE